MEAAEEPAAKCPDLNNIPPGSVLVICDSRTTIAEDIQGMTDVIRLCTDESGDCMFDVVLFELALAQEPAGVVWIADTSTMPTLVTPNGKLVTRQEANKLKRRRQECRSLASTLDRFRTANVPMVALLVGDNVQHYCDIVEEHGDLIETPSKVYCTGAIAYHVATNAVRKFDPSTTIHQALKYFVLKFMVNAKSARVGSLKAVKRQAPSLVDDYRRQQFGRREGVFTDRVKREDGLVGGLRRTAYSVSKVPGMAAVGCEVGKALEDLATARPDFLELIQTLLTKGAKVAHTCTSHPNEVCLRCRLEEVTTVARETIAKAVGAVDTEPVDDLNGLSTNLRPGLFEAWAKRSGDPDGSIADWLRKGGPCGIELSPEATGVFECVDGDPQDDPAAILEAVPEVKSSRADASQSAYDELMGHVNTGYIRVFDTAAEASAYAGGSLVLSDVVILEKMRPDGTLKLRTILNCKTSGVSRSSRRSEHVVLPRITDVAHDLLELMGDSDDGGSDVELTVADIEDAYWNIPIAPQERKYFACQLRGRFFVFLRATQGSRGGPLLWARVMAFAARFGQATCSAKTARVNVYVDDPIILAKGAQSTRRLAVAKILMIWMALGMRIAWHKAQVGTTVTWTSATFCITCNSVIAKIKEEIIEHIRQALVQFDTMNVILEKAYTEIYWTRCTCCQPHIWVATLRRDALGSPMSALQ